MQQVRRSEVEEALKSKDEWFSSADAPPGAIPWVAGSSHE